jgi:hypothetical protein
MPRLLVRLGAALALIGAILIPQFAVRGAAAPPAPQQGSPAVSSSIAHGVTGPIRDAGAPVKEERGPDTKPLHLIPRGQSKQQSDAATQGTTLPAINVSGGPGFAGVGQGDYGYSDDAAPPDPNLAVGATQVVQWVNESFAVFNKATGAKVMGPTPGNTLWQSLTGTGCANNNDGDPIVQYDKAANRWILTQFSVSSPSTYHYLQCVAVSQTDDATGKYNLYVFDYGTTQFNDYPKLGVWPDAYYVSYNIFTNGSSFAGSKVCAFDRAAMIAGVSPVTQQCFQLSSAYGGLLPADLDGSTPPPTGTPGMYLAYDTNSLDLWKFHVDWTNTANTTLTGPINIPVAAFSPACNGGGTCIPQPGTSQQLDSLADRLMYRLAYRNFGDHESLVVNHSVTTPSGQVGVRWYELRNPAGSSFGQASAANLPVVYQQATYAPDSSYRWMGSIAMDHVGDMALGYSVSSSTVYPSIRITGRTPGDPANTMESETAVKAGGGNQNYRWGGLSRWGDYTSMSVDPSDDCTFWYTDEYQKSSGGFNWSTWIYSFTFPGCSGTTGTPPPTATSTPVTPTATPTTPTATPTTPTATPMATSTSSAPASPSNLSAQAIPHGRINLTWTDNATNETAYSVERSTSANGTFTVTASLSANTTTYQDTGLTANTAYFYRVRASNAVGYSGYSNTVSATAKR